MNSICIIKFLFFYYKKYLTNKNLKKYFIFKYLELEMSKRAPGSTLTQDNWDNEDKNEEQGNWTK